MLLLPENFKGALSTRTEYGMGFQLAKAIFQNGEKKKVIILNATLACSIEEFDSLTSVQRNYEYALRNASRNYIQELYLIPRNLESIRQIDQRASRTAFFSEMKMAKNDHAEPANKAPITMTSYGEIFNRFSAYENDIRVTKDWGLTAGTFATTIQDAIRVKTGMEAVARYALENKEPANKVFTIEPPSNTKLQRGTVEPAYGEPGGGEEVIFVDGSPAHTVSGAVIIPER